MPASSMCSMMPPMTTAPVASATQSTSNSKASSRNLSISTGPLVRDVHGARHVAIERRRVVDDRHAAPAEHVRRPDDDRETDRCRDVARLGCARSPCRSPAAGCRDPRAAARTAGDLRRGRSSRATCPESTTPAACSGSASFSGVCPPNCTRHDTSAPADALLVEHRHHVLERERLEVQAVGRVVVGRDGLGVAVDHHRLEALLAEREGGVTAAVVELDPLPDAVRPAAEDDDLLLRVRIRLAERLVRPVHVRRERLELRRARVDALVRRRRARRRCRRCADRGLVARRGCRRAPGRRSPAA